MTALTALPAGRYFVGDPCYVIDDVKWMDFLEKGTFAGNDMIEFEGGFAGCVNTESGDGEYYAEGGYPPGPFPVDAGLLGAVSENLIRKDFDVAQLAELGVMVDFKRPFTVTREGSVVAIGHICIETGGSTGEEEEDDDNWFDRDIDEDEDE